MKRANIIYALLSFASCFLLVTMSIDSSQAAERKPWTNSRVTGSPLPPKPYRVEQEFKNIELKSPVEIVHYPVTKQWVALEINGKIFSLPNDSEKGEKTLVLDVKQVNPKVKRVLSFAFHPDVETTKEIFIVYTTGPTDDPKGTHVARFNLTSLDPPQADPKSEEIFLEWKVGGHNGSSLKFGPDGYLYISTGDGSPPFPPDTHNTGQSIDDLLASILRIDINHKQPGLAYAIPKDNPFVNLKGARGEVYAYGFRNPWRMNFDAETGDLWVGDVGWELWEMVYLVKPGGNYGWSIVEGPQPVKPEGKRGPTKISPPIIEHPHTESRSVTGGFVYRGDKYPDLKGAYVYGDYVTGKIWALKYDGKQITWKAEIANANFPIISFGQDGDNELHVLSYTGEFYRLVKNDITKPKTPFPTKLSDTGIFSDVKSHKPSEGVLPYSINAEAWADGAQAVRMVGIPDLGSIEPGKKPVYPKDTVFVKTLMMPMEANNPKSLKKIETQLLHFDGFTFNGYSYRWNDSETDAELVPIEGDTRKLLIKDKKEGPSREYTWTFHNRNQCITCHNDRGFAISFTNMQLDKAHETQGEESNLLDLLNEQEFFKPKLARLNAKEGEQRLNKLVNPHDESQSLDARARSYIHANCAFCHQRGGGGNTAFLAAASEPLDKAFMVDTKPNLGRFGIPSANIIQAGDPYSSILYYRMSTLKAGRMPRLGSHEVDSKGVALIREWITSLAEEPVSHKQLSKSLNQVIKKKNNSDEELASLLESTMGALLITSAIDGKLIEQDSVEKIITAAKSSSNSYTRGIFERYLPESERQQTLGTSINPIEILALKGNAEAGKKFFFESSVGQCKNCHRIGRSEGKDIGPDLSQVGKKLTREKILDNIIHPSKLIEPKYVTQLIETADGQVITGMLDSKDEKQTVLKNAKGELVTVKADDIELMVPQQKSLMPELLLKDMTAQEVADLIAYLSGLK